MARPRKHGVDYFPHFVTGGKTIFTLESQFGNDGYAFWFKLLELLGDTKGHFYDCNDYSAWSFLIAKSKVSEETAESILNMLAKLDAIDKFLWSKKIIWSQNFVNNIEDVYRKRGIPKPSKPGTDLPDKKPKKAPPYKEIIDYLNTKAGTKYKHNTEDTQKHIRARFAEGFTTNDFKIVIDKKIKEWDHPPGPDGKNTKAWIRPSTLFGSKFDSYLNQKGVGEKQQKVNKSNFEQREYTDDEYENLYSNVKKDKS